LFEEHALVCLLKIFLASSYLPMFVENNAETDRRVGVFRIVIKRFAKVVDRFDQSALVRNESRPTQVKIIGIIGLKNQSVGKKPLGIVILLGLNSSLDFLRLVRIITSS